MASGRRLVRPTFLAVLALAGTGIAFGQANGKLQIHYVDVGQGDAAVLISPLGQVVLFDDGVENHCDKPVSYLAQIGLTKVDYHIATHYHNDHIGCAQEVLTAFPLLADAYDRGGTTLDTYMLRTAIAEVARQDTGAGLGLRPRRASSSRSYEVIAVPIGRGQ